ncbi:hypothetical protein J6590_092659, partial [Homalodisca vitripennis]
AVTVSRLFSNISSYFRCHCYFHTLIFVTHDHTEAVTVKFVLYRQRTIYRGVKFCATFEVSRAAEHRPLSSTLLLCT